MSLPGHPCLGPDSVGQGKGIQVGPRAATVLGVLTNHLQKWNPLWATHLLKGKEQKDEWFLLLAHERGSV